MPDWALDGIQDQLESVTNQVFRRDVLEDDAGNFLCAFRNDMLIDYIIHVVVTRTGLYDMALAMHPYGREVRTFFERRLERAQYLRVISDPRGCVRYMVGQV